jgi:PAS domain S-box-containing protein
LPDSYEGFYKAVFENSQRAIISTNAEATVLCHNSPFNCLMGAEAGSLSGQPLEKIVAFDDMSGRSFFDTLSAAAQSQDTVFAQLLSNSQQPVHVRLEVMEAKDASGVSGYVIFADDMSRIDGQKEFLNSVISLQAQGNLSFEDLARALFSECQRVFGFEQAFV